MPLNSQFRGRPAAGFSLLEMVVALVILALALGALYQAAGGATRNVRSDEQHAQAVELARSLLAENALVPVTGLNIGGKAGDEFNWRVSTAPVELGRSSAAQPPLHQIEVVVDWRDGSRQREFTLHSVVPGYVP